MKTSKESSSRYVYFEQNTLFSWSLKEGHTDSVETSGIPNRKKRKEGKHIKTQNIIPRGAQSLHLWRTTLVLANKHNQSSPLYTSAQ